MKKNIFRSILAVSILFVGCFIYHNLSEKNVEKVIMHASWAYNYANVQELTNNSDLIACISVETGETYDQSGIVKTKYQVNVVDKIYGEDIDTIEIIMTGGIVENTIYEVEDDPLMGENEEYMIFARENADGTYTILSGSQGRFIVENNMVYSLNEVNQQVAMANADSNICINGISKEDFVEEIDSYLQEK